MKIKRIGDGVFRVTAGRGHVSMLSRYGIFREELRESYAPEARCAECEGGFTFTGTRRTFNARLLTGDDGGFSLSIPLSDKDRIFGCGDATRDHLSLRGTRQFICVANVSSYGPQPILLSSEGWGLIVNSTYRMVFDIGAADPDMLTVTAMEGRADFYLLAANDLPALVRELTDITGKPMMLPAFAYGLTFVQNEQTDTRAMLENICRFRDRDIPCDIFGLEPSWMVGRYDFSTGKRWDPEKFYLPHWCPPGQSGTFTFFFPMREKGMQLSLWLCNNYDLLYEEDRRAGVEQEDTSEADAAMREQYAKNGEIVDEHLIAVWRDNKITNPNEPWFEHLKKFVDNGAACFKLDGSNQVLEHPDHTWGDRYSDREVHNIYPVLLAKQMQIGFREYTDRRLMLYTAGAYAGTQQFAATWTGDTGGGPRTLIANLNYAMCGHTNTTCDMDVLNPRGMHYAFLSTWSQHLGWANWLYPWYLSEERENNFREYARLRSSLFPYIYSMAHIASMTGIPVTRPLPLIYHETDRYDNTKNMYMLGESLLVGAFDMRLDLPDGEWIDYFDGKAYSGKIEYQPLPGKGGALLVKSGSVFVTMKPQKYILEKEHDYIVHLYPGGQGSFTLYEDDGFTYDYENGGYAETPMAIADTKDGGIRFTLLRRRGDFGGRPDNGHNHFQNSIPKIDGIRPVRDMTAVLHGRIPGEILLDGEPVPFTVNRQDAVFTIPAAAHAERDLLYTIR